MAGYQWATEAVGTVPSDPHYHSYERLRRPSAPVSQTSETSWSRVDRHTGVEPPPASYNRPTYSSGVEPPPAGFNRPTYSSGVEPPSTSYNRPTFSSGVEPPTDYEVPVNSEYAESGIYQVTL